MLVSNFALVADIPKTEPAWKCKCTQTLARCGSFVLIFGIFLLVPRWSKTQNKKRVLLIAKIMKASEQMPLENINSVFGEAGLLIPLN